MSPYLSVYPTNLTKKDIVLRQYPIKYPKERTFRYSAFLQSTHVLSQPAFFSQHCLSPCFSHFLSQPSAFSHFLSQALSQDLSHALSHASSHVPAASQQSSAALVHPSQSAQSAHSVLSHAALSEPLLHAHETAATIAAAIARVIRNFFIITTFLIV